MVLTTTDGQDDLPRYFSQVFNMVKGLPRGRVDFVLPDGRTFRAEAAGAGYVAEVYVHNVDVFARLVREGDLGFSEAYLDGWWSTPDLMAFMDLVSDDAASVYEGFPGQTLIRAYEKMRFWLQSNSKRQAKKNISYHYDLGNEFYGLWLDDTMTYSSAKYVTGQEDLEKAQIQKYASMVDEMGVKPGDHVLEIGCGWGGFAEYAAKERGLKVTGLTISEEQFKFAVDRIEKAGLSDVVQFKLQDYREEVGTYDGIASIEMFEAVGEKYWPTYFNLVRDCLKPGARGTFQIILVQDERAPTVLRDQIHGAGLEVTQSIEFGDGYSETLRRWFETFNEKWDQVAELGFDDRFRRMWNFYLTSCAGAFRGGICDVTQITVTRRP